MPRDIDVDAVLGAFDAAQVNQNPFANRPALVNPPEVPQVEEVIQPSEAIP